MNPRNGGYSSSQGGGYTSGGYSSSQSGSAGNPYPPAPAQQVTHHYVPGPTLYGNNYSTYGGTTCHRDQVVTHHVDRDALCCNIL